MSTLRPFKVYTADRETGKESVLFIDAIDQTGAMEKAADLGWLVSTAIEVPNADPSPLAPSANTRDSITALGGLILIAMGIVVIVISIPTWYGDESVSSWSGAISVRHIGERFQDDNAVGASANALELLHLDLTRTQGVVMLCAGLLIRAVAARRKS